MRKRRRPQTFRFREQAPFGRAGEYGVSQNSNEALSQLDETQAALRESIEQAKKLAEKSDSLLQEHKRKIAQQQAAAQRDAYLRDNPE